MEIAGAFQTLGIALGLGLLVGMQRERGASRVAGIRTFPLITILGALTGMLVPSVGGWVVAAALAGVVTATTVGSLMMADKGPREAGITTEIAILLMFGVGVFTAVGPDNLRVVVAVAVGGTVALLLHAKDALHNFAERLGDKDVRAIMQFVLISFIILPVLPDRAFDPLDVLNPHKIWLFVVLVVGIGLTGYLLYKFVGARAGLVLGGIVGGAISSTSTTVSFARRCTSTGNHVAAVTMVIMLATCVMYVRVLIEIASVAPDFLSSAAPPILVMLIVTLGLAQLCWLRAKRDELDIPEPNNPSEMKAAIMFAAGYTLVMVVAAGVNRMFADDPRWFYLVSAISGTVNMDAITLSTSQLVKQRQLEPETAWRAVMVAAMASLVFKIGVVMILGTRGLAWRIGVMFATCLVLGAAILAWWPSNWNFSNLATRMPAPAVIEGPTEP